MDHAALPLRRQETQFCQTQRPFGRLWQNAAHDRSTFTFSGCEACWKINYINHMVIFSMLLQKDPIDNASRKSYDF
jgi:hypothetical protein